MTGIKFTFHGEKDPITYGKKDQTTFSKAVFSNSEEISTIKCSKETAYAQGRWR